MTERGDDHCSSTDSRRCDRLEARLVEVEAERDRLRAAVGNANEAASIRGRAMASLEAQVEILTRERDYEVEAHDACRHRLMATHQKREQEHAEARAQVETLTRERDALREALAIVVNAGADARPKSDLDAVIADVKHLLTEADVEPGVWKQRLGWAQDSQVGTLTRERDGLRKELTETNEILDAHDRDSRYEEEAAESQAEADTLRAQVRTLREALVNDGHDGTHRYCFACQVLAATAPQQEPTPVDSLIAELLRGVEEQTRRLLKRAGVQLYAEWAAARAGKGQHDG